MDTYKAKASLLYLTLNKSQRAGIRMGLFPAEVMAEALAEGFEGRRLTIALMEVSKGGVE